MELRHLRYFNAVAEELNFSRAAQRLGISQPPLSQQIRQLERELGVELFQRDSKGVRLTEAGRALWTSARRVVDDATQVQQLAERLRGGNRGQLNIGFVGSALYGQLPDLIRYARERLAEVRFVLEEVETGDQIQALSSGRIDVGILRPPITAPALRQLPIGEEPLVAVLPHDHRLAGKRSLDLAELSGEDFVLFPRPLGAALWNLVVNSCVAAGFHPTIVREVEHVHTMVGLVASGIGVTLVPRSVSRLALPGVRYLTISRPRATTLLGVAWHSENPAPVVRQFVSLIEEYTSR